MPGPSPLRRWITTLDGAAGGVDGSLASVPGRLTVHAGWDTGSRSLPEAIVYLIVRGSATATIAGRDITGAPGTCMLIPAGTPFRLRAHGPPPTILRLRLVLPSPPRAAMARGVVVPGAWEIEPVMAALIDELAEDDSHRPRRLRSLAILLLTGLDRLLARGAAHAGGLTAAQRSSLDRLVERSRAHGLQPTDLAEAAGLTLDYFTRRFRRSFGMAPRRWLVRDRIRAAAARLAEGDEPLAVAAQTLGYADMKLFGRQFRAVMGMPPARWRRERRAHSPNR